MIKAAWFWLHHNLTFNRSRLWSFLYNCDVNQRPDILSFSSLRLKKISYILFKLDHLVLIIAATWNYFQMFSPLRRSTTSCCMRSLRAPILSTTLSFSSTAPAASPPPSLCSFTHSAIPVSCQPDHYSQVISRRHPLKVGTTQSMLVRKLSSADEGKREESEAEKKRSAQLSQVHRFLHSVTFYYLLVFSQVLRPGL